MNKDEKIALDFLKSKGFNNIKYEPAGNVPPDFIVNGNVAIEVRRLNQNKLINNKYKPLETLQYKITQKITQIIQEFETDSFSTTLIVAISYSRPLKINKTLIQKIKKEINYNLLSQAKRKSVMINENLELSFYRSDIDLGKSIILGFVSDDDAGGFVVSNIYENIKIVIPEKEMKIKKYYDKYSQWWLVLIDHISSGLDHIDKQQLLNLQYSNSLFKRIFIVSPENVKNVVEI